MTVPGRVTEMHFKSAGFANRDQPNHDISIESGVSHRSPVAV